MISMLYVNMASVTVSVDYRKSLKLQENIISGVLFLAVHILCNAYTMPNLL